MPQIAELEQFMLAFPTDLAPVVGQQVSIGPGSPASYASPDVSTRIGTLDTRAGMVFDSLVMGGMAPECDTGGYCSLAQEDADGDEEGDACELTLLPEPGGIPMLGVGVMFLIATRARRLRSQ